jgi:N-acetylneuraminic acid mutarotase
MSVFAIIFAASGCSSASNPIPVLPFVVAGVQKTPQSDGSWTTKASMHHARSGPAVGVVNGILYAVGGWGACCLMTSVEAYNPATDSWTAKAQMPTRRYGLAAGVINGRLYAVGGCCDNNFHLLGAVEAYDPVTNTWITEATMPTARYGLAAGVINGKLYAIGGDDGSPLNTVEAFNPR